MHTPTVALGWELWRRHRPRLIGVVGLVLGFALLYPILCRLTGFDLDRSDGLGEVARKFALGSSAGEGVLLIFRILFLLFLACGPMVAMMMSLLFVIWVFTFTEVDPRTKDPMSFPVRLFSLPVSTPFLHRWLLLAGLASVTVLCAGWHFCVRMPQIETFAPFQNPLVWLALLPLLQGITLALAGWPRVRMFVLSGILMGFSSGPGWREVFASPLFDLPVFLLGIVLARIGLQKARHGEWQAWPWSWPFGAKTARAGMRGPRQFASPAQAQLWFEWRRFARPLCLTIAVLVLVPVVLHLLVRFIWQLGPLSVPTMSMFLVYLVAVPVFMHFCFGMAPPQADLPFLMNRPLTNGAMMMATLKTAGLSTLISWALVFMALCGMPWLGDWHEALKSALESPPVLAIFLAGMIFQTWRIIPVGFGFTLSGHRRLAEMPVWLLVAFCLGWAGLNGLFQVDEYRQAFLQSLPVLLAGLAALKIGLACMAFRLCLQRRLLSRAALTGYLAFWFVLVIGLLIAAFTLLPGFREAAFSMSMAVILFVPLARIGFGPIALAWNRHA